MLNIDSREEKESMKMMNRIKKLEKQDKIERGRNTGS